MINKVPSKTQVISVDPAVEDENIVMVTSVLRGKKGDTGEQGVRGEQGPKGNDGYTPIKGVDYFDGIDGQDGTKGDKGPKGDKGDTGLQGIQGPKGDKGDKGDDGYTPIKGIDYFDGEQGPKGDKGDTGEVDYTSLELKADKTYVDSKVQTDIPVNAKFTDTITTINGKTGTITKADITALGIPAQDTVVDISGKADITYVDDKVKTDVPVGAKFTDTITTINGNTGVISKADIVALGIPSQDTNTTYSEITTAEIDTGTDSTLRTITGRRIKYILDKVQGWIGGLTKSDVGLSNVDDIKQMPISGGVLENYREKLVTLSGTSTTINLLLGNVFTHSLTGNTTYSITNAVNGQAHSFTLIINQTATVGTLTFPASVRWQGGEIPDMSTANKIYTLTFMSVDGGANWLGMFGGEF